jgi:plasmid stability protein
MATLTIRNIDDGLKQKLRERAAAQGISLERNARALLTKAASTRRKKSILKDLRSLGASPSEPFDLKAVSDEMWDEGLR